MQTCLYKIITLWVLQYKGDLPCFPAPLFGAPNQSGFAFSASSLTLQQHLRFPESYIDGGYSDSLKDTQIHLLEG